MDLGNWGRTVLRIHMILEPSALHLLGVWRVWKVLVESVCAQDVCCAPGDFMNSVKLLGKAECCPWSGGSLLGGLCI